MFSSLTKKTIVAASGAFLGLFLLIHALGNATIYGGKKLFLSYAYHLHSLGPLVSLFEVALLFFFLLHIVIALLCTLENRQARPIRYQVDRSSGGRTLGSRSMLYTGLLTLLFLIIHLKGVHFVDRSIDISTILRTILQKPLLSFFYMVSAAGVALHVSHGFWSLFQTFGWNRPNVDGLLRKGAIIMSLIVGLIFIGIPVYALLCKQFLT